MKFLKFLRDFRLQLAEDVANSLATGNKVDAVQVDQVAFVCGIYLDLENIQFEDIKNFYAIPEKEGKENDDKETIINNRD